ncbi:uncharacterized protein F5Z01DRAFT_641931 [Emericellopsis atlantica]|uniref:Secreted protein n=1 Tax=Emericellopsis atlantica TaxID=2614577 RepID=A0A9P7ZWI3_9HYPO|nr:uncharacterized protein F5Z01DRAFT_641931 [Emericellopsis atlantica]KAG9258981.1 hypothetical protein F5Z01DRAFT_641931 [Emericellopsis atlantica]
MGFLVLIQTTLLYLPATTTWNCVVRNCQKQSKVQFWQARDAVRAQHGRTISETLTSSLSFAESNGGGDAAAKSRTIHVLCFSDIRLSTGYTWLGIHQ